MGGYETFPRFHYNCIIPVAAGSGSAGTPSVASFFSTSAAAGGSATGSEDSAGLASSAVAAGCSPSTGTSVGAAAGSAGATAGSAGAAVESVGAAAGSVDAAAGSAGAAVGSVGAAAGSSSVAAGSADAAAGSSGVAAGSPSAGGPPSSPVRQNHKFYVLNVRVSDFCRRNVHNAREIRILLCLYDFLKVTQPLSDRYTYVLCTVRRTCIVFNAFRIILIVLAGHLRPRIFVSLSCP